MSRLLPPHPGTGQLFIGRRPHTAPSAVTYSSTGGQDLPGGSRLTWTHRDRGRWPSLGQVEPLIHGRMADIRAAFLAVDPDGTGLVSKEEFRRVLESLLCVSQKQLDALVSEVCERSRGAVDYMQFLRSLRRAPVAQRACSSCGSVRPGPQNPSMSLSDIQKHLKDKIGGNLRTVIRVFRVFDNNREGRIERHEFRRIMDNYCIQLTDKDFQRLWNHYSPNNASSISYEMFLEKLGFGDSHNFKIAPVCTKIEVSSRWTTPSVKKRNQRPESASSSDAPSVLPHRKLQSLFLHKMCMNSTPLWQALQAFDITHSGLVEQDVLRAVLSSFIFPMNPHSFQRLTSCYGVKATGPVRWKHFLGRFMSPVRAEDNASLHSDRAFKQPGPDGDNVHLQDIYPQLKEIFHLLDKNKTGRIARADLHHFLERPGGTRPQPQIHHSRIAELVNALDPEHSGVIQLSNLEGLNPSITAAPTGNTASPPSPANTAEETEDTAEQQKTPDEKQTTECVDEVSVAPASWRTVENLLLDKLCEQLSSVLAALKLCDPQHTGYVTQEELKTVLSCYGMSISDTHFNKLCETSDTTPGLSSTQVYYTGFLRNLGVPLADVTSLSSSSSSSSSSSHRDSYHTERPCTSPQSTPPSARGQRPPSSLQVGPDTCNILGIIFQRMRRRLEQRRAGLTDRVQALTYASDGTLSEADVRKILEDSWVMLDDKNFNRLTDLLGFKDGRVECSAFLAKYEEAKARDGQQSSEGHGDKDGVTSAEECLAAMKTRIKTIHEDNLTAFRLMDRKRKGVVDCHDFKVLYTSLGLFCREVEYQRLLDLIGLHPGGNLNYAEFVDVIENNGKHKQRTRTATVQEQLHELLAREARYKWADMSKVLCQFDSDGHSRIHKRSLRELLYTYALPMRSDEFDQLWLRYDPERQGCVAVCDFLEKLGFHPEGEFLPQSQKMNQTVDADRSVSPADPSLGCIQQTLQENFEGLSDSLTHLETRGDGTVTVEQLLSLLQTFNCSVQTEQLVKYLRRLNVSMDESCKRLSSMDFLSAFEQTAETLERPPATPDVVHQIESLASLSPVLALARMQELVAASAPNLYKAFLAFDRSGTGMIKALEFGQVLDHFCARLSDKQYRYMLTKLELDCDNCTVNWKDFLDKFQSEGTLVSADRCLSRTKAGSHTQTKTSDITGHLHQIQEVVSGHLYEVTKQLMDLDPTHSATVSKEQFRQLCDRHSLRLTNDQFECVWSQMPVNEQKKLQYREFLKRFGVLGRKPSTEAGGPTDKVPLSAPEPRGAASATTSICPGATLHRRKSAPQCTSRHPSSVGRPGTGSLLGSMERRLRGAVQRCWRDIQRNCTKEDPQHKGHISRTCFLEILQSLNINMTQEQLEHLAVKFDIMKNGCISYHSFLRHFLLNLNPAETKRAYERRHLPLPTATMSHGAPSRDCVEVMLRIYDVVRSSWTSIRRCFLMSDRARTGLISVQDFRKVLRHFSISLSEEDFFHLASYFDANTTEKICYNSFLWAFLH